MGRGYEIEKGNGSQADRGSLTFGYKSFYGSANGGIASRKPPY